MSPPPDKDKDFFEELDDDLGEDWESAFQAEDFMFSPEDDTSNFFLVDENHPEDNDDLASLMEESKGTKTAERDDTASISAAKTAESEKKKSSQAFLATLLPTILQRPLYQKVLLGLTPLLLLSVIGLFFLKSNGEEQLAQQTAQQESPPVPIAANTEAVQSPVAPKETPSEIIKEKPATPKQAIAHLDTVRKKWPFHSFLIMTEGNGKDDIFVNIDLTIIAALEKDVPLSEEKRIFLRDAIYQFYKNRPIHDLKRYALARGDMIHQLNAWLKKQWPDGPIETVMFSRYQVVKGTAS